ncbi:hypothetical protein ACFQ0M_48400 [Kitasatospora aburaviensis]|uniref:HNH endonuclease n=1 Tax=Kitasatospora aburaviensis TaxID=67265 RepID=A0ABW1EXD9_9ACTN
MGLITEEYFGFEQPKHGPGCKVTGWEVRYRAVERERGEGHGCRDPKCEDHGGQYTDLRVQILCRSCDRVTELTGKQHTYQHSPLAAIGYGTAPVKAGPVWLYAGLPILHGEPEVFGYLVATRRTEHLVQDDVIGQVRYYRTPRGAWRWEGHAQPRWHRDGVMVAYRTTQDGFVTPTAAAKWVAAQPAEK